MGKPKQNANKRILGGCRGRARKPKWMTKENWERLGRISKRLKSLEDDMLKAFHDGIKKGLENE